MSTRDNTEGALMEEPNSERSVFERNQIHWLKLDGERWLGDGRLRWVVKKGSSGYYLVETDEHVDEEYASLERPSGWGWTRYETVEKAMEAAALRESNGPWLEVNLADGSGSIEFLPMEHDVLPMEPQPEIPPQVETQCESCLGLHAPVYIKPVQDSGSWWDDPFGYWVCHHCFKVLRTYDDVLREKRRREFEDA